MRPTTSRDVRGSLSRCVTRWDANTSSRRCPGVTDSGSSTATCCWCAAPLDRMSDSIVAMGRGSVELEPEARDWLEGLPAPRFVTAAFYIDLLAEQGPHLSEPYTRRLDGKLRELRFHLDRRAVRITYWIASGRRIVLLTVFVKTPMREHREIDRARRALAQCVAAEHDTEGDQG